MPSLLQRFWDQHGSAGRLMLVLCGSSISFMEQEVLAERSPLFGRRTGQLELLPLGYREAAGFLPRYSPEQWVQAYGILGGMPMYQVQFEDRLSLAANVQRHLFDPSALLYSEPEYLLRMELRDPGTYNSVLEAIAAGLTRHNEIADRIGRPSTTASPYLATLERLRLIERVAPLTSRTANAVWAGTFSATPPASGTALSCPTQPGGTGRRVWTQRVAPQLEEFRAVLRGPVPGIRAAAWCEEAWCGAEGVGRFWSREWRSMCCVATPTGHTCSASGRGAW